MLNCLLPCARHDAPIIPCLTTTSFATPQLQQELDQLQYHRAGPPAGVDAFRGSTTGKTSRTTPYQTPGNALALTPTSPPAVAAVAGANSVTSGMLGMDHSTLSLLEEERRERAQLERTISSAFGSMVEGVRKA
jgi:hypothetical protein